LVSPLTTGTSTADTSTRSDVTTDHDLAVPPHRRAQHLDPRSGKDCVEPGGELGVPIADQEPGPGNVLADLHERVAGLLRHPLPDRMRRHPSTWTRRVATSIANSTYSRLRNTVSMVQEVHRQHTLGLGSEELPPGERRPHRRRIDAGAVQDGPHRAGADPAL
jgi:hypothetical protein